jgi:nicotinate phosphoribosyltransferase
MRVTTDLYELSMALSYLGRGMRERATFSLFVRALPPRRGFLVAAGVQDALDTLEQLEVMADDVQELAILLRCDPAVLGPLLGLRFTGDVLAVPEGRIVRADEPLLEVTAELPQAQLAESVVLNALTYSTALCTKATRCVIAAQGLPVIDFALRRTHGLEAADTVARVSAIAGFAATSNVSAAARHGLRATGTMAHSYVQAFADEESAFRAFAADVPVDPTFLIDTYDLAGGTRAAIRVIRDLGLQSRSAVRVDSGDLDAGARLVRGMLDDADLPRVGIVVSGGLDEYRIAELRRRQAPIDVFAVGTAVGVGADAPSLDSAYKLVQLGDRPVCKLSVGKATAPGAKQVWRNRTGDLHDILSLREEERPLGCDPLLKPVMAGGRRLAAREHLADAAARLRVDLSRLAAQELDLSDPRPLAVRRSARLMALADELRARVTT